MKRKGVSPVFATALLVLVTVIAGILFYSWYKGYQRETQGRMDEASYPLSYIGAKIDVSDLNVEKIDVDGDALPDKYIVSFVLKNVGSVDLHNIQIFVDDKQESIVDYLSQNSFKSVKITLKTKPVRLHIICKEGISFQSDLPQVEKVIYDPGNLLFYVSNSRKISFSLPSGIIKDFIIKIENVGENTALLNIALNGVQIASPLRVEKLEKKEIRLEDITRKKAFLQYGVNVIDVTIVDDSGNPASGNINVYIHPIVEYPTKKLWLSGWQFRRKIEIEEQSGNDLINYQIPLTIDTQTLIRQGKLRDDCSDIRFTDATSSMLLNYWIEPDTCNTTNTRIWVKVPFIAKNSEVVIYMYYGNEDTISQSNARATLSFYDDFSQDPNSNGLWEAYRYSNDPANEFVWDSTQGFVYLTKAVDDKGAMAFMRYNGNLDTGFMVRFRFKAGGGTGADGLAFAFYKDIDEYRKRGRCNAGGCLALDAYDGTSIYKAEGYDVEFDNFHNGPQDDQVQRHVAVTETFSSTCVADNNHYVWYSTGATEDYEWHSVKIYFAKTTRHIMVFLDGNLIIDYSGGPFNQYDYTYSGFGFSAATGGLNNEHIIDDVMLVKYVESPPIVIINPEESFY